MAIIVPYDERLEADIGGYITPYGDILIARVRHEDFARDYCLGCDYDYLTGAKIGPLQKSGLLCSLTKEEYEKQKGKIDVFSSSNLSLKELEKLKVWLNEKDGQNVYSDFLVYALSYDKVERKVNKLITSAAVDRHVRFFNYYLMGWRVEDPQEVVRLKSNSTEFAFSEKDFTYRSMEDVEAEDEIIEITSRVPLAKRPMFFK